MPTPSTSAPSCRLVRRKSSVRNESVRASAIAALLGSSAHANRHVGPALSGDRPHLVAGIPVARLLSR